MKPVVYKKIIGFLAFLVALLVITQIYLVKEIKKLSSAEEKEFEIKPSLTEISKGTLVFIIDDFGYRNDEVSDGFLALDISMTCAVIPGHVHSRRYSTKASDAGKEVIVHMPMESTLPTRGEEEFILKTSMTSQEVEDRVRKVFEHLPEAVGMNNHQGSKTTTDGRVMTVVGNVLKEKGKYFIDSRTTSETVAEQTMLSLGVNAHRRHVFLDNDADPALIQQQIRTMETISEKSGIAIGIGHVKPNTLNVLSSEIPRLKDAGFTFKFASEVLKTDL